MVSAAPHLVISRARLSADSEKKQASPHLLSADILALRLGRWTAADTQPGRDDVTDRCCAPGRRPYHAYPVPQARCCAPSAQTTPVPRHDARPRPTNAQTIRPRVRSQTGGSGACEWVHSRQTRLGTRPYIPTPPATAPAAYPHPSRADAWGHRHTPLPSNPATHPSLPAP